MRLFFATLGGLTLSLVLFLSPAQAARKANYQVKFRNQLGAHINKPSQGLATNRMMLDGQQTLTWTSGLQAHMAGRVRTEGAYSDNPDIFTNEQAQKDASDVELRDLYLKYGKGSTMIRVGNQQVVWGEAFGFFFADLVNPKDLRENSLFGLFEMADLRDPIPLVDFQWRGSDWTIQLIYGLTAPKNRMPRWGAPLSGISSADIGGTGADGEVKIKSKSELDDSKGDTGLRMSNNFGNADVSVFGFSYIDRMPYYTLSSMSFFPFSITLQERQSRVASYGATLTYDFSGYLLRSELVFTEDRRLNTLSGATIGSSLANEGVVVLGLDLPPVGAWTLGFQGSHTELSGYDGVLMARDPKQSMLAARLSRDFLTLHKIEMTSHWSIDDGGSIFSGRWTFSRSSGLEFLAGWEALYGGKNSMFGRMQDGSRFMIGIRSVFNG